MSICPLTSTVSTSLWQYIHSWNIVVFICFLLMLKEFRVMYLNTKLITVRCMNKSKPFCTEVNETYFKTLQQYITYVPDTWQHCQLSRALVLMLELQPTDSDQRVHQPFCHHRPSYSAYAATNLHSYVAQYITFTDLYSPTSAFYHTYNCTTH